MLVGIVGGGIAGLSLALSLQKHRIKSIIWEKDHSFDARSQGYGLTLQQGGRALKNLGILDSIRSASQSSQSHFIFSDKGQVVIFWGAGSSLNDKYVIWNANRNLHIARQNLRSVLMSQIDPEYVEFVWNASIKDVSQLENGSIQVYLNNDHPPRVVDILAGCDGIFSRIRQILIPKNDPLNYLGMFVMLGIFENKEFPLYQERVVQMSDGKARIFMMPFDQGRYMWQLSFPMGSHQDALDLSLNPSRLQGEALERCKTFHSPIPEMIRMTETGLITGYPVYDRDPLPGPLPIDANITLVGDAAHPMSPFKGQGANQAIIDAFNLAQEIQKLPLHPSKQMIRDILTSYEKEMINRTTVKLLGSRESVSLLHTPEFVETDYQLQRRGFDMTNNRQVILNLNYMQDKSITIDNPLLDIYSFSSISL